MTGRRPPSAVLACRAAIIATFCTPDRTAVTVYLVGAGPGDPGLLTVRGAEVLARADVVVHDRLAEVSLLDLAPRGGRAHRRRASRRARPSPRTRSTPCSSSGARGGQEVVRLKGGDPFVFGRGGEEAAALAAAGVPFEVVPGITSAVAVPAYAGIPVTHRGLSTSFTVVTGHQPPRGRRDVDWEALARVGDTIVVLMGVAHRAEIAGARSWPAACRPTTPVAAVRWGTRPGQRTVRTTLAGLAPVRAGAAGDHRHRRGRRPRPALVRGPPAVRPAGGGHPGPRPGVHAGRAARAGWAPRRSSCRPSRSPSRRRRCRPGRRRRPGAGVRLGGVHVGQRRRAVLRPSARRPGLRRHAGWRPSGRAPPPPWPPRGVVADLVPERPWPRRWSRPFPPPPGGPALPVVVPRAVPAAAARRRCPTACGPRAGRSTWSRPTAPSRHSRPTRPWRRRPRPTPSRSRRRPRSTNYLDAAGGRACRRSWPASGRSPPPPPPRAACT